MLKNLRQQFWTIPLCLLLATAAHLIVESFVTNKNQGRGALLFTAFFVCPLLIGIVARRQTVFYSALTNVALITISAISYYTRYELWNVARGEAGVLLVACLFGMLCAFVSNLFAQKLIERFLRTR